MATHSGPAVKPSPSSRRTKRRRGAPSCGSAGEEVVSLPSDVRAATSKPASSSATALSPRLAAAPPMPSSLAPARCSEATPDELEQRLRFYACQIKSFRKTILLYSSPELMEKIKQMEEDYETAVRQFYCRPPSPTPSHMSSAAAQSMSGLQNGATATAEQPTPGLQGAAAEQPTSGPQPDSKSASTSSRRRRGRQMRVRQAFAVGRHGLHAFAADRPGLCVAGPGARLNSVPAREDLLSSFLLDHAKPVLPARLLCCSCLFYEEPWAVISTKSSVSCKQQSQAVTDELRVNCTYHLLHPLNDTWNLCCNLVVCQFWKMCQRLRQITYNSN
ncbi:hypothetical protein ATANTOWER_032588 [Ataeniobius toweri]|uniref:Uncharacterized protein n=1 Tax=Ataeniobius toweri TaxID=208326 RepID=A0ABU7B124_9TELE|nr:hypothetical protein [Ataeniobius toweri]